MGLFKKRAEPGNANSPEDVKDSASGEEMDALLEAALSGDRVTWKEAMGIPAFSSCLNLIADTVSMIPIRLYKRDGEAVEEVKGDIRTNLLNLDTKDSLDAVQFKRAMVMDYYGKGGYAYINRVGNRVESLHYVDNREISFMYSQDPIFKDYKVVIRGAEYEPYQFIKVLRNTKDGREGTSIVDDNNDVLSVVYSSLLYEKNLVRSGGNKKGFIRSPKKLAKEAIKELRNAWNRLYRNNSENVVILNDGLEFQESSNTSVELQLNENKKTNSDEICKIFHMPPEMVKGGAKEDDKINFIQYCINPVLAALENALNRDLLLETEKDSYFFSADTSELTKGDIEKRFSAYEKACKNGFMQIDEIRFRENMRPLGLEFIKLGLQDVLFDPKTKEIYVPNMEGSKNMKKAGEKQDEGGITQ